MITGIDELHVTSFFAPFLSGRQESRQYLQRAVGISGLASDIVDAISGGSCLRKNMVLTQKKCSFIVFIDQINCQ